MEQKPAGSPGRQRLYCSENCRVSWHNGRKFGRTGPLGPRTCLQCQKVFQPRQSNHTCCSDKCNRKMNAKARRGVRGGSNYYRRLFILERGGVCERCGVSDGLEVHHIVPVAAGGAHVPSNVLVLCRGCHHGEHQTMPWRSPMLAEESYVSPFVGKGAKRSNLRDVLGG